MVAGQSTIDRWTWHHVALVRNGNEVRIYLDGNASPEIEVTSSARSLADISNLIFGGRGDHESTWEGRLDEIAVFDRALSAEEVQRLSGQ
ncbi:MAG: LamG domain-containing protein [Planctomycetaceae bacterium]